MDIVRTAVILDDANKSLRSLFKDKYEELVKSPREVLLHIMADTPTDNPLKALTIALQRVVEVNGEYSQTTQVHSIWLCAAAADLCKEKGE
jgi:hypothetical protein